MGKYMRKAKVTGEVAVMEVAQSTIGVLTRAKTLALQRLQKTSSTIKSNENSNGGGGSSYFQLRSQKLEKPPLLVTKECSKKQLQQQQTPKESCKKSPNPKVRTSPRLAVSSVNSGSVSLSGRKNNEEIKDEASLDIEERDRSIRESTICSLIRDSEIINISSSTTKTTNSTSKNRRIQNHLRGNIPTTYEMEEFFAVAEQHQQRLFIERYNFDPVNDMPLAGRYEWVRVDM